MGCSIYIGERCAGANGTGRGERETATAYYDTSPDLGYNAYGSAGRGQCGELDFVNVWA